MRKLYYCKTLIVLSLFLSLASCVPDEQDCKDNPELQNTQACQDLGSGDEPTPDPGEDDTPDEPTPVSPTEPTPEPPVDPGPTVPSEPVGDGTWQENAEYISDLVDGRFNNDELSKFRKAESFSRGDACHQELQNANRFADAIAYFVEVLTGEQKVQLQGIASFYGMSSSDSSYFPVSLTSHPLCRVTSSTLNNTIRNVPGSITVGLANRFANDHNRYRASALSGNKEGEGELRKLWGTFFGCLAYSESLSTADTSSSNRAASKYAPSGYRKPAGVKFYEDPAQNEASRLNIGMFQFTPTYTGNINPCFRQWNRDFPSCTLSRGSRGEIIPVVGSSLQHFNAYCGVHKLLQTFSVQVNSSKTRNTHPDNKSGSSLKSSAQRCVTPHFYAGWAYNHFGPLQNSTGSNLNKLLRCIYPQ
jgi:hypothetical protein